ncbi:conjugal transfer protein [Streptomyces mangrovisoli]|uniref:Conjugal transfer protein n=1 Tax=Streptomyces mangrovisoli TaxID=1428628 RepID=A0A1J4NS81_9ACTN|nr:conjugal transfer protein [Streptomyces mangrovisoli]OIJ64970.1 conjugal transfer protein [Streptomyces mangrovisoli]
MSPGKQASPRRDAGPVAGSIRLQRMRRRVRLSRLAVCVALATGPLALALSVTSGAHADTDTDAAPRTPAPLRTNAAATDGASGCAQLFVGAWLRSSAGDADSAQARLARRLGPAVDLPDRVVDAQPGLQAVLAVRSAQVSAAQSLVTVAAQDADGRVRYYAVPVAADEGGARCVVTAAPAAVAGPGRATAGPSSYAVTVPTGSEVASSVGEFLTAYLTGAGRIDRYLAPDVSLSAVEPAAYQAVSVTGLEARETTPIAGTAAADGTTVHVLAQVEARDAAARWPLAYALTLRARSGRWEVAAFEAGSATQSGGGRS